VDAFADLMRGVRANGSVFGQSILSPPWSLRFIDGAPLTLCALLRGEGWIVPEGHAPQRITVGDAVIVRGPLPFSFVDDPATEAPVVHDCGEHCVRSPRTAARSTISAGTAATRTGPQR
jgi:hypothetical protein